MRHPNFREEKRLWKKGYKRVAGLDEAGRGPLAGPVVAVAMMIKSKFKISTYVKTSAGRQDSKLRVRDSKKLTPKRREELYKILTNHPQIKWGIGRVSERVIDRINILQATKLAMKRAVEKLKIKNKKLKIDFLLLDGNFKIDLGVEQKSIVKADNKVFSCAAASIIAKVTRDRMMRRYCKRYPEYGFSRHKGYGTKLHLKMLKKHGPCKIHRKSFKPLKT